LPVLRPVRVNRTVFKCFPTLSFVMHGVYFGIFQNLDIDVDNVKCSASDVNSMATYKYIKACLHCITLHHVRALLSREKESKRSLQM
jgi:hypothetical protein